VQYAADHEVGKRCCAHSGESVNIGRIGATPIDNLRTLTKAE
jgi:hypothetical protein